MNCLCSVIMNWSIWHAKYLRMTYFFNTINRVGKNSIKNSRDIKKTYIFFMFRGYINYCHKLSLKTFCPKRRLSTILSVRSAPSDWAASQRGPIYVTLLEMWLLRIRSVLWRSKINLTLTSSHCLRDGEKKKLHKVEIFLPNSN